MPLLSPSEKHTRQEWGFGDAYSLAIPARTLERWRGWWRDTFKQSGLWLSTCAAFMPPLTTEALPDALLERFLGTDAAAGMSGLLRYLAPLTVAAPSQQPSP